MLETVQLRGSGYRGWIDDEQLRWLERELVQTPATTPVIVAGHVPIFSTYAFARATPPAEDAMSVSISGSNFVLNCRRLLDLFNRYPQVRLAVAGHEHTYEQITYNQVTYATLGSASGNGDLAQSDQIAFLQTPIGYAILDLWADGTHEITYRHTGPRDADDFNADDIDRFSSGG